MALMSNITTMVLTSVGEGTAFAPLCVLTQHVAVQPEIYFFKLVAWVISRRENIITGQFGHQGQVVGAVWS